MMRSTSLKLATILAIGAVLAGAGLADAAKVDELNNPADYSRDFQVGPGQGGAPQIQEGFEGGTPPSGVTSAWTVIDNAGDGPIWTDLAGCGESGNFTNGSGDVACVSSDEFGSAEFDTELITESYDFCDGVGSALTFTVNYQNFAGLDFFEVDHSTDGSSWTNLLSWNEDHGSFRSTPGEDVNLDVSALDGAPQVWFRYHYFDPNADDFDWYVQVDDFVLESSGTITTPGAAICATGVPTVGNQQLLALGLLLALGGAAFVARGRLV